MTKEWLPWNDMDNIDIVVSNYYEMTKIWKTNWKLITKWLMYNDMGNVDHLPTYLPTHPPTYLPITCIPPHAPTYLPTL